MRLNNMRTLPTHNASRFSETRFSPPSFPPKAGKGHQLVRVMKRGLQHDNAPLAIAMLLIVAALSMIFLIDIDLDYEHERSNRNIVLEDGAFFIEAENRTEIAFSELQPGDLITFTHSGNITEVVYSSTSCSSSTSMSDYGTYGDETYYRGADDMECWTEYYTHYVLNASTVSFESSSVSDIYMCHRSTCKVTGELVYADDFLVDVRTIEVIS